MNLDIELESIIKKYTFRRDYLRNYILQKIRYFISEGIKVGKMGIVGAGEHTMHLINDFSDVLPQGGFLVDNQWMELKKEECFRDFELVSYDKVKELDVVIVSSYVYRREMTKKVKEMNPDIKVVDFYSFFEDIGVHSVTGYYNLYKSEINPYFYLILLQQQIENKTFERKLILQDIIYQFLQIRDLQNAKKYIDLYLKQNYDDETEYKNLKCELEELEKSIQDILKKRDKKDIIWVWQDGLRYDTSLKMPYLNECRNTGLDFKNSYTLAVSTRNVYTGIFERKSECDIFLQPEGENQVKKHLEEQGYATYRIWGKDDIIPLENFLYRKNKKKPKLVNYSVATSQLYWEVLKLLVGNTKPVFAIVHAILETHPPFCAPTLKEYETDYAQIAFRLKAEGRKKFDEIYLQSALYLDSLNEYFAQFFPKDCVRIYMSDHGYILNENSKQFTEELVHVPFVVTGGEIKHKESESLFSLKNLYEMLEYILEGNEDKYDNLFREFLDINGIDLYAKPFIEELLACGLGELHIAYCGVRTLEDVYILEATGDEYYGSPKDIKKVECVSVDDELRIKELRKMCKKTFVDISKDERFKDAHMVYQAIGKERRF
ncbi:MAG: sulfatase-like hydrolase/transferase [Lachnospiraceae bacterium]|nr:sulfatase-like hydrolase/transferase [Lachnospiraceae bacterium]